jgi:hypothetical protein
MNKIVESVCSREIGLDHKALHNGAEAGNAQNARNDLLGCEDEIKAEPAKKRKRERTPTRI